MRATGSKPAPPQRRLPRPLVTATPAILTVALCIRHDVALTMLGSEGLSWGAAAYPVPQPVPHRRAEGRLTDAHRL
eukprot:17395-Chlamydomonas_euryale.AAC.1